ncbi:MULTISPECIES: pYEATS domain-containing protein [Bradyrhizobium]|jgi:uncharacterized LabA/DUF88 family protein|uniref:pYEATS domain-containing protein n=2 Tax=Pseudomonadota TaxID=1224 RepID=UPI0004644136|nr:MULTISPECIES: pYEATS domain-containing protein [Bradyrhizobium]KIU51789.1 hypothetical protein QU41_04440 [Bradyrhizobium elkanii]MBK5656462.1 TIR domain-containing protein [Rhizobium sp.]OCX28473.1 hypothetical protein QU42_25860 [Bradyrhizobium sp. UASWS1016]
MSYRIAQDFEYVGKDYWRWHAWIESGNTELDKVKEVVWILHPSFRQPRVVSKDRADKFRLSTAGWGTFVLRAEVMLSDAKKVLLKHNVELEYPDSDVPAGQSKASDLKEQPPTVFLSYSAQDSRVAAKLRAGLEDAGVKILDQTRLEPGAPWSDTLRRMIEQSDGVVGLVSEGEVSPWVNTEIQAAAASAKPTLVLVSGDTSIAGLPKDVQMRHIDVNRLDFEAIAADLGSFKSSRA